jgi:hypothetical protein
LQIEKQNIMCTYNITVNDTLIERARPAIGADTDIAKWMQRQVETLLIRLAVAPQHNAKATAEPLAPELETILAMPLLNNAEVGLNGEQARMEYLKERYAL